METLVTRSRCKSCECPLEAGRSLETGAELPASLSDSTALDIMNTPGREASGRWEANGNTAPSVWGTPAMAQAGLS